MSLQGLSRRLSRGLDWSLAALRAVSAAGVWLGGGLLVALSLGIGAEVLLRRLAGWSFGGMDELGGYALAIVAALAFTEALLHRSHIRIGLLHQRLGSRGRVALDLVAMAGLIAFFGTVLYYGALALQRNAGFGTRSMTPLAVPLAIPQALWIAALALFVGAAVILLARAALAAAMGEDGTAAEVIGLRDTEGELREEEALSEAARGGRTP